MTVVLEIPWREPVAAFARLRRLPRIAWLDGNAAGDRRARYATLAADPFAVIDTPPGGGDPFPALAAALATHALPAEPLPVPFAAGAIGLLGYELARHLERLSLRHPDRLGLPDMAIGLYDVSLGFDLVARRCWILSTGRPFAGAAGERRARGRAEWLSDALAAEPVATVPPPPPVWTEDLPRAAYLDRVGRLRALIQAGDIYQANLTARYRARRSPGVRAADLHLALRAASPAPFSAFLCLDDARDIAVASASPERFLHLDGSGAIETRPIKGTRRRDPDPMRDAAERAALAASGKDRAENLMIVDLLRNDLSRVAEAGSVHVPSLFEIESFAGAHHLVSSVRATLRAGLGPVDLLRACFPGGSVTGAPKLRAIEIIEALETARRGAYCGAVVRIGFDGAMDSSIVIRTLAIGEHEIAAQAGGAITHDSDAEEEWAEMRTKLTPMLLHGP